MMTLDEFFTCPICKSNDHREISKEFHNDDGSYYIRYSCNSCGKLYTCRFRFDFSIKEKKE